MEEGAKKKFCFVVSTRYRNFFLKASDQYDLASWIENIKYQSEKLNSTDSVRSFTLF